MAHHTSLAKEAFDLFGLGSDSTQAEVGVRLKDLCTISGVRDNQLHGIGLVVGLEGTGDGGTAVLGVMASACCLPQ